MLFGMIISYNKRFAGIMVTTDTVALEGDHTMQIPVLIEPVAANGFRARTGEPLLLTAEGATREEALDKLQQLLTNKLKDGTEMATLYVGPVGPDGNTCLPPDHPLA